MGTNSAIWGADIADYSRYFRVYAVDLLASCGKSAPNHRLGKGEPGFMLNGFEDVFTALRIEKAFGGDLMVTI